MKEGYIRDCYYRLLVELLRVDFSVIKRSAMDEKEEAEDYNNGKRNVFLVVLGNPGVGKSSLSFLFIRCLLELGVEVCVMCYSCNLAAVGQNIHHFTKNRKITFTLTHHLPRSQHLHVSVAKVNQYGINQITSHRTVLVPSKEFIQKDVKKILGKNLNRMRRWVVCDE
jgi:hypothetical protein